MSAEVAAEGIPGLNPRRLVRLMAAAIERCRLDLSGYGVFTEAASGAYLVTPVLAAMAGASRVFALARSSRYGSREEIAERTFQLAELARVADRIELVAEKSSEIIAQADIVTNSGHVRPIDREMVSWMKASAVVPLMYEAWEYRGGDLDLAACRAKGIPVVGTNERHPAVDVFSFLGVMAVKLLLDAGISVVASRILLVCDNPFASFIERGLRSAGARLDSVERLQGAPSNGGYDAVLVARTPTSEPALSEEDLDRIARQWPGTVVVVYWGDLDRTAMRAAGLHFWPLHAPAPGHMGVLPSAVGPDPIVRLQSGSLKAAEARLRHGADSDHPDHAFGQAL